MKLWDLESGVAPKTFGGHEGQVHEVSISIRGDLIASISNKSVLRIWDASEEAVRYSQREVKSVLFSPVENHIIAVNDGKEILFLNALDGTVQKRFKVNARVYAFDSDGSRFIARRAGFLSVWSVSENRRVFEIAASAISCGAFSPDGSRLVVGGNDNSVRLLDADGGATLLRFDEHRSRVSNVAFSPNGTGIVTGSDDGTIKMWSSSP